MNAALTHRVDGRTAGRARLTQRRLAAGPHDWHLDEYTDASGQASTERGLCLMLHGTGASAGSWSGLADHLVAHLDIVAPDLPAHARTRTPAGAALDIDRQAADVEALIEGLGRMPSLLVGHSAGAVILAAWALRRRQVQPTQSLPPMVCLNAAMLPLEGPAGWLFQPLARVSNSISLLPRLFALRAAREPDHVGKLLRSTGSAVDADMLARYQALLADPAHVAGVLRMMASWQLSTFARRLPQLDAAVHMLVGEADRTIPVRQARRLAGLIPGATLDLLPGLGHLAHEEAPDIVARTLLDRLALREHAA